MGIKILHISDLHIISEKRLEEPYCTQRAFHQALKEYVVNNFKDIDCLLLTGDFGDQCHEDNVAQAKIWLSDLVHELGIDQSKIILCPGNHDINTANLVEDHHDRRIDFSKGREYLISSDYSCDAFDAYEDLRNTIVGTADYTCKVIGELRFVILNSSWLSQTNLKKLGGYDASIQNNLGRDEKKTLKELFDKYGGLFWVDDLVKTDFNGKKKTAFLKPMLNLSENKTQQLGVDVKYETLKKELEDGRDLINILVFHHPETHLHPFERNTISGLPETGIFKKLSAVCELLICGHTHPINTEDISKNKFNVIPNLVGGGAHVNEDKEKFRPIFYVYTIDQSGEQRFFRREMYFHNGETFEGRASPDDKVLIGLKPTSFSSVFSEEPEQAAIDQIAAINKTNVRCYLNDSLLASMSAVDSSFFLTESCEYYQQNQFYKRPGFQSVKIKIFLKRALIESARCKILYETFFIDELDFGPERECVAVRIEAELNRTDVLYYPLFVDSFSLLLKDSDRDIYRKELEKRIVYFFDRYQIKPESFFKRLARVYPEIVSNPDIMFREGLYHVDRKILQNINSIDISNRFNM